MSNAITFQFDANKLRGVALFAARNDIRYYLNGVFFTRAPNGKGMIAVATDGHRLTAIYHEQDVGQVPVDFPGVIVPTAELLMAAKAPIKNKGGGFLDVAFMLLEGTTRVRMQSAITVEAAAVEGKYPDYQRVIPSFKERAKMAPALVTVNAAYLADYAKLAALLGSTSYRQITIQAVDQNSSVIVGIGHHEAICILMPMRGDGDDFAERDWLKGAA